MFAKIILIVTLATAQGFAGVTYTAVTRTESGDGDMKVRSYVSGANARLEFIESQDPALAAGNYLLSRDGGNTILLVSPGTRTYTRFDVHGMLAALSGTMKNMRGLMHIRFDSPQVEKLVEEAGVAIAGLPTRHYRFRTTYTMTMDAPEPVRSTTTIEEDVWATSKLVDRGLEMWLNQQTPHTGDEQLDQMIAQEMGKVKGMPLKRVSVQTSKDKQGKEHVTRTEMEVTAIRSMNVAPKMFIIPAGYKKLPAPIHGAIAGSPEDDDQ